MRKEYTVPELKTARFSEQICTAVSGGPDTDNGAYITEQALKEKGIENTERSSLSLFEFIL